jgi:transposase InsO family protein
VNNNPKITKKALAKKLGVSRSSLYYKSKINQQDLELLPKILKTMEDNPSYGHRRVAMALGFSKGKASRIMKKFNLQPERQRRKPKYKSNLDTNKYPNLVKNICPIAPNIVWASDFTYIKFENKFFYLATVIDIFSKKVLGWHILKHHNTDLVRLALLDAVKNSEAIPEILHSDQGSEYESREYTNLQKGLEIQISRSKLGSPWENGFQESFYSQFKLELGDLNRFKHFGDLIEAIHLQINYYNKSRIHSKLKMSPDEFFTKYQLSVNHLKTRLNL